MTNSDTEKERAVQKGMAMKEKLENMYDCEFRLLCNTGAPGSFEIRKYGTPTLHIDGSIFSDKFYVDIWERENSKHMLYTSGYHQVPKEIMFYQLSLYLPKRQQPKQITLF